MPILIFLLHLHKFNLKSGDNTINSADKTMNKNLKKQMKVETFSKAQIIDEHQLCVKTPDGEIFTIISSIGMLSSKETQSYYLHLIEAIFDRNFSEDRETMTNSIWRDLMKTGVDFLGMNSGNRHNERIRIGAQIRSLRENKKMEARDLAMLANIDAANLCRIEQGKYSVGLDILSRIAFVLGVHVELVANEA